MYTYKLQIGSQIQQGRGSCGVRVSPERLAACQKGLLSQPGSPLVFKPWARVYVYEQRSSSFGDSYFSCALLPLSVDASWVRDFLRHWREA